MAITLNNKTKFTKSELAFMRKMAARNGFAINSVNTKEEELEALIKGLPVNLAEDMLQFIEARIQPCESDPSIS